MKIAVMHLFSVLTSFIETGASKTVIGFSRSLLAADLLLKFVFNDINFIIPSRFLQTLDLHSFKYRCNFFLIFNPSHLAEMQIVAILILAFVIIGYYMKITALLHFWIAISLFTLRTGYTSIHTVSFLLTLLLIPVCSFDERKNHWHHPVTANKFNSQMQNIFLLFIKLQVAFIYYDSFHDKLFIKGWQNGSVIYYWFTHNFFGVHPSLLSLLEPVLRSMPVLIMLSWCTLAFEALLAIALLFSSRFKLLLLKYAIIFHFSILLIHGFASLFLIMSAALFLYLYPAKPPFALKIFSYEK